jgi:hypothetical protein
MELSDATEKAPVTLGIDPGTFQLVVQFSEHCDLLNFDSFSTDV